MTIPCWKLYAGLVLVATLAGALVGGGIGAMSSTDPKAQPDSLVVLAAGGACMVGGIALAISLVLFTIWCSEAKADQFGEPIVLGRGKPGGDGDHEW